MSVQRLLFHLFFKRMETYQNPLPLTTGKILLNYHQFLLQYIQMYPGVSFFTGCLVLNNTNSTVCYYEHVQSYKK